MKDINKFYHDLGNDRWVAECVFPGLTGGYFIEAGATNGINGSGTIHLERKLGWRGLCVEVIPRQFGQISKFRDCQVDNRALWSESGQTLRFSHFPERSGRSGLTDMNVHASMLRSEGTEEEILEVQSVTLSDLLTEHRASQIIDYFCLDIEGAEPEVLGAFDFHGPHTIRAISIEGHACDEIMKSAGYRAVDNPFTDVTFETYWLHPDTPIPSTLNLLPD
ncbi:MAG: FkbM family methyltransferase [Phycisphaerales bacterium]|nr:FkbM family methyltransferase [Phycisphaerales bacterium]